MEGLAIFQEPNTGGRVRRSPAPLARNRRAAESPRFLSPERPGFLRNRTNQRRLAIPEGLQPSRESETMGFRPQKHVPCFTVRSIHLPRRNGDHCRLVTNFRRVFEVSRQALLSSREWSEPFAFFRILASFGPSRQARDDFRRRTDPVQSL